MENYAASGTIFPGIDTLALRHTVTPFGLIAVTIIQQNCPVSMEPALVKIAGVELPSIIVARSKGEFALTLELVVKEKAFVAFTIYSY